MNRNKLPRWVNRLIDHIADSPTSLPGQLAARRLGRPAPRGSVSTTRFGSKPIRLLIAPVNYSGQARAWVRALEASDSGISAQNMAVEVPGGFAFDADLLVPVSTFHNDRDWQRREFEAAAQGTHMLIEAEEAPFGRLFGRSVAAQAQALIERGVDVGYLAHGTDVRLPSRHMREHPRSYFADPSIYVPRAEQLAARNIAFLNASGRAVFVSTPDLLADLPSALWCPVVIDSNRWAAPRRRERPAGQPLRVAHAPSVAANKGTPLIMPTLDRLSAEGLIELDLIQGVPSAQMPTRFAQADVVLDQFRTGSYGVAACEAMAAGCVVVGDVSEQVRAEVHAASGTPLPVVEAQVDTLEDVLRGLSAATDLTPLREQGLDFVHAVHGGEFSAAVLRQHWLSQYSQKDGSHAPNR